MSFIENILESFGIEKNVENSMEKAILFGDQGIFLEGIKGIKTFDYNQIILFTKKGEIKLTGEKLFIKKFCMGDVVVCGKIVAIERS